MSHLKCRGLARIFYLNLSPWSNHKVSNSCVSLRKNLPWEKGDRIRNIESYSTFADDIRPQLPPVSKLHLPECEKKHNSLSYQSEKLNSANDYKPSCIFTNLPLHCYFLILVGFGSLEFCGLLLLCGSLGFVKYWERFRSQRPVFPALGGFGEQI